MTINFVPQKERRVNPLTDLALNLNAAQSGLNAYYAEHDPQKLSIVKLGLDNIEAVLNRLNAELGQSILDQTTRVQIEDMLVSSGAPVKKEAPHVS